MSNVKGNGECCYEASRLLPWHERNAKKILAPTSPKLYKIYIFELGVLSPIIALHFNLSSDRVLLFLEELYVSSFHATCFAHCNTTPQCEETLLSPRVVSSYYHARSTKELSKMEPTQENC